MPKPPHDIWASITERGQVTIPAEVREALGLSKPGKVIFRVEKGKVLIKKPEYTLKSVFGSVPPLKEPKAWDEMMEIVADDRAEAYLDKMREGRA